VAADALNGFAALVNFALEDYRRDPEAEAPHWLMRPSSSVSLAPDDRYPNCVRSSSSKSRRVEIGEPCATIQNPKSKIA